VERAGVNMDAPRFDYQILEDGEIEILIGGRDKMAADGKYIDLFTQKKFRIESKEILEFEKFVTRISFAWCKKFNCRLDKPECH
jgi:hypothetical protein